mgnify:CR=1 FL=1
MDMSRERDEPQTLHQAAAKLIVARRAARASSFRRRAQDAIPRIAREFQPRKTPNMTETKESPSVPPARKAAGAHRRHRAQRRHRQEEARIHRDVRHGGAPRLRRAGGENDGKRTERQAARHAFSRPTRGRASEAGTTQPVIFSFNGGPARAAYGCTSESSGRNAWRPTKWEFAAAAVCARRQRAHAPVRKRPGVHRSGRYRPFANGRRRKVAEFHGIPARPRRGGRVHSSLPRTLRPAGAAPSI